MLFGSTNSSMHAKSGLFYVRISFIEQMKEANDIYVNDIRTLKRTQHKTFNKIS
jgi:hypothetical protein